MPLGVQDKKDVTNSRATNTHAKTIENHDTNRSDFEKVLIKIKKQ